MSDIGKLYAGFVSGIEDHDRANPDHSALAIGLAHFDMERLGLEDGETLFGSITIQTDNGCTGNFRVICDGHHFDHDKDEQESEDLAPAVSKDMVYA